jgi:hypothetical protein
VPTRGGRARDALSAQRSLHQRSGSAPLLVHSMFSFLVIWAMVASRGLLSSAGLENFALACHSAMSLLYLACIAVKASPPSANP